MGLVALLMLPLSAQDAKMTKKLKPVVATGYTYGDTVKDFKLINIDDEMVGMENYPEAEAFIVIFSCNHCPYSVAYEDRIIDLANKYKDQNIETIMISSNDVAQYPEDSFDNMKVRAKEKGFPFPYLFDETQEVARRFGATRTPHVFLVDKEMVLQYFGAIDDNANKPTEVDVRYLEEAIEAMRAGRIPSPYKTKAIGCSIKWKS